jgi:hypothetical protein
MGSWGIGTTSVSSDGINWTTPTDPPESLGGSNTGKGVIWDQNSYNWVICGNWLTPIGTPIGNFATLDYSIKFNIPVNPQEAVTGSTRSIAWNPDTSTWIASAQSDLLWADDIVGTNTGQISTSSDGLIWSTPFFPESVEFTSNLSQITVIKNRTYILGETFYLTQSIIFSPNGIDWTLSYFSGNMSGNGSDICWNGSIWVLVGYFSILSWGIGASSEGPITISTDGITWSDPIIPVIPLTQAVKDIYDSANGNPIVYSYYLENIAWNGNIFVATGQITIQIPTTGVTYTVGCIVTSSDGITWTVQTIPGLNTDPTYSTQQGISGL